MENPDKKRNVFSELVMGFLGGISFLIGIFLILVASGIKDDVNSAVAMAIIGAIFIAIGIKADREASEKRKHYGPVVTIDSFIKKAGQVYQLIDRNLEKHKKEKEFKCEQKKFRNTVGLTAQKPPVEVVVLGGSGWEHVTGIRHLISIGDSNIRLGNLDSLTNQNVRISEILDFEISGPGTVTSGGGFIGGGFGATAVGGIAIASVLNALTSYTKTKTLIRFSTASSECVMSSEKIDLEEARIYFSEAFVAVRRKNPLDAGSLSGELVKLKQLHSDGVLSDDEFANAKAATLRR